MEAAEAGLAVRPMPARASIAMMVAADLLNRIVSPLLLPERDGHWAERLGLALRSFRGDRGIGRLLPCGFLPGSRHRLRRRLSAGSVLLRAGPAGWPARTDAGGAPVAYVWYGSRGRGTGTPGRYLPFLTSGRERTGMS